MLFRTMLLFSINMIAPFILLGIHQSLVYMTRAPRLINIIGFQHAPMYKHRFFIVTLETCFPPYILNASIC